MARDVKKKKTKHVSGKCEQCVVVCSLRTKRTIYLKHFLQKKKNINKNVWFETKIGNPQRTIFYTRGVGKRVVVISFRDLKRYLFSMV